jgi:hypothetical protein
VQNYDGLSHGQKESTGVTFTSTLIRNAYFDQLIIQHKRQVSNIYLIRIILGMCRHSIDTSYLRLSYQHIKENREGNGVAVNDPELVVTTDQKP